MNTKRLVLLSALTVVLLMVLSVASFAQTYVNNTNGDDLVGTGTAINPYKTIATAITNTASGGTISIAADTYGEAAITVTKPLTFVATTFNSLSTVTITNGLTINTTNATDVVSLGETGQKFNLGALTGALKLTKGVLNIASANVIIGGGGRITRTAGTINNTPTVTNAHVYYDGTADITAGAELPAAIGTGSLNVGITAGKTITIPSALTTNGGIIITTGNASFTSNLTLTSTSTTTPNFINAPNSNTVTVGGTMTFTSTASVAPGQLINGGTGVVTVNGNATWTMDQNTTNLIDNQGNGNITMNGTVTFAKFTGTSDVAANHTTSIRNLGTGTLTLAVGFTRTGAVSVTAATTTVYTPTVDATNSSTGTLAFGGSVTMVNLTNNGTTKFTGGTVSGTILNDAATSKIEILAAMTWTSTTVSNGNVASIIKLNANTLTLAKASSGGTAMAFGNGGKVISTTASTVGTGVLSMTNSSGVTITGGEIPNVTMSQNLTLNGGVNVYGSITSAKTLTLGGTVTVMGDYSQNVGGTLALGANIFGIRGNWTRVSNVPGDVTPYPATSGQILFAGSGSQTFTSGASLQLYDVVLNKTASTLVTLTQTVEVTHNFTITSGTLALGDNHVRMTGAGGTFDNTGGYTSSGNGYIIFDQAGAQTITGTGLFSNIDVRTGVTLTATSALNFSGSLILRNGTLVLGANNFTYKNDLVAVPSVTRYNTGIMTVTTGVISAATGVLYDLTYAGNGNMTAAAEWKTGAGIRNLTIATGDASTNAQTVTAGGAATTVAGVLTVNENQTLNLNTFDLTLSGTSKAHTVVGKVVAAAVESMVFTGTGSTLAGSTSTNAGAFAEVPNVFVNILAAESFASTNIKTVTGNLTVANGTVTWTMFTTAPTVTGNVTLTAGSLNFAAAGVGSTHGGNLVLTAGALTYTRSTASAADYTIGGSVTLTAGTLTLGSSVIATGITSQVDGNVVAAGNNYTAVGAFTRSGAGAWDATTGKLIVAAAGAVNFDPGATAFTVPNFQIDNGAGNAVNLVNSFTVSNAYTHKSGTLTLGINDLTLSGSTLTFTAGAYTQAGTGAIKLTGTDQTINAAVAPSFFNLSVSSTGTLTLTTSVSPAVALTFAVNGAFTQAGNISTGIHTLAVGGTFTRTAGTWAQGTGYLVFGSTITAVTQGTGFAVDNLECDVAVSPTAATAFTVNKNLLLKAGVLTMNVGKLVLGDGCVVERQADGAYISTIPTFSGAVSVVYSTAAITTVANFTELPASVTNFSVLTPGAVTLPAAVTVTGTLTLSGVLTAPSATLNVTMANNATLVLKDKGTTVLPSRDLALAGAINIVYNSSAGIPVTTRELGALNTGGTAYKNATGNVEFKSSVVTLDYPLTIGGTVKFSGGTFEMAGNAVTVQGDMVQTKTASIFTNAGVAATLTFGGSTNTLMTLFETWQMPANNLIKITIAKAASSNTVTLSGGDLDFAINSVTNPAYPAAQKINNLYFAQGVLVTGGTSSVILKQDQYNGQPVQGFDRSGVVSGSESHVYGRVKKFVNADGSHNVDISAVTFPVGTLNPNYRPMTYFFKTTPQASINLTVSEVDVKAGGLNGFPITAGTLSITNYPNFYWYATSDVPLSPSYKYDLEAQAKGYTDYMNDQIQNVRFVRRDSGSVNNPWILQANNSTTPATILYDNSTIASNWPVVKVIDATGGITSQGSIFAYSQSDKPPTFTAAPGNTTLLEGATFTGTFAAADPDLNQGAVLSVQATTIPAGAYTFNATTGVFTWVTNAFSAGAKTLTIRATATNSVAPNDYRDTTITITVTDVPTLPTLATIADQTISALQPLALTLVGASADTDRVGPSPKTPLKYWIVSVAPAISVAAKLDSLTGAFAWTPAIADTSYVGFTFTVKVNDGVNDASKSFKVIVAKSKRTPYFTASMAATLNADMGTNVNFTYVAADSDGFALTYSITKGPGTIGATTGAYNYYVPYAVPGTYVDTVTVKATNGVLSTSATTIITRVYKNVKPYYTAKMADGTLNVGDTLQFTYVAADSNGDAVRYYGVQYPAGAKVDSVTGKFFWVAASQQTAIYVIKTRVTDNQGGADTTSAQILVQVMQVNVTGAVTYNGGTVPVNGVSVTITGGITPQVVTTNTNGAYTTDPNKLNSGLYTFSFTKTGGHPTVYTNAADALKAALYSVDPTTYPLSANAKLAADVNNDGNVNSADALQIMLRYVGSVTSFAKGDWIFVPTATSKTLTNADFVNNAVAIAVGDVNSDAQPGGAYFAKADGKTSVVAEAGKPLRVNSSDMFEVPVRMKAAASFGSMSLAFQYSTESAEFVGVRGPEGMVSAANNGMVAVAWFNANKAMNLKENDAVVTLRFKPTANIKDFTLTLDPNSQVTDAQGTVLSGIGLEVPAVDGSLPTAFAIGQNYPNPFNPSTTIQYDLPVAGHVTMVVYNMLGQVVDRLVDDQQNPGTYKIRWDASKMSSGVYMYHITVDAGKQTFKEVRRMVLLK